MPDNNNKIDPKVHINFWYVILGPMRLALLRDLWVQSQYVDTIPYSQFEQYLEQGIVEDLIVGKNAIRGRLKEPQNNKTAFVTNRVDPGIADRLTKYGVAYTSAVERTWLSSLLSWVLPMLLFFGFWIFVIRRLAGGGMGGFGGIMDVGKSRAKIYAETETSVSFDDVAGVDEAKEELVEIIEFMRAPQEYGKLGAHIRKGILLIGPPGTGKPLLARAVAGEAEVPFFSMSVSEFVGVGATRVRDLFETARKQAPAIIFIDELDALGRARSAMAAFRVAAFTATRIPGIDARVYPPELASALYPDGIPIVPEAELEKVCAAERIDAVVFAYSDGSHAHVMHLAARAAACGCDFELWGPGRTMLQTAKPVVAVTAVRTGCGKSQVSRFLAGELQRLGQRVAMIRHPMPYSNLARQAVQRFATITDLEAADCTIEKREEYEPYVERGLTIFARADYALILATAEAEADLILWNGGNNDFSFVRPNVHITLVDALRPGHETIYWPGEANLRMADIVVVAKSDAAGRQAADTATANARAVNQRAEIIFGDSPMILDDPGAVKGKRVLVVEDGPTITHGGMATGAGSAATAAAGPRKSLTRAPLQCRQSQRCSHSIRILDPCCQRSAIARRSKRRSTTRYRPVRPM